MSNRSFFDTNILVYTDDMEAPTKADRSLGLMAGAPNRRFGGVVSIQVLQEYFWAATRKLGVDPGIATENSCCFPERTS